MVIKRFTRVGTSFAVVFTAYWIYALVLVPFIEPSVKERQSTTASQADLDAARRLPNRNQRILSKYFPPGSWEREGNAKVLENGQAMLLVKDYRNLPDGRVELRPCSLLFFPKSRTTETGQPAPQVIIMQAPQGAVLEFDEPFDLKRAKVGKLVGGQLVGQIMISSGPDDAGGPNELRIVTRDVQIDEQHIWTPYPVDFRLGANYGSGRDMQITLLPSAEGDSQKSHGLRIGGIEAFQLLHEVKVHVQMAGQGLMPGAVAKPNSQRDEPPVEVTCQGPFHFDLLQQVATFSDQVDVIRLNPVGPSDQMNCELLSIYFDRKAAKSSTSNPAGPIPESSPVASLEARLIEAQGNPVIIRAPSSAGNARCQRLEYEIKTGRISLEGSKEVMLHQETHEIHAPRIDYQIAEAGRLGQLFASGPGFVQGTMPDSQGRKYQARWTKQLRLRPQDHNQVLSLLGNAQVQFSETGSLGAEEIHLWLLETAASSPLPAAGAPGLSTGSATLRTVAYAPAEPKYTIEADRMMALGRVRIDSPRLTGATGRLEVWFQQVAASAAADERSGRSMLGQPSGSRSASQQRFDVGGALIRIQMAVHDKKAVPADLLVEGQAHFAETKTARPGAKPLQVKGDRLHVAQADTDKTEVTVAGKPAHVEARGMSLSGAKIQLEKLTNRLWIDGAGRMTFPGDRTIDGRLRSTGGSLEVTWQGSMNFDGRTADFKQSVIGRGEHQLLRTEELSVSLKQRIDFSNPPSDERREKVEVDMLTCRGGAYMENRTFDAQGLVSIDQMQLLDLSVNQSSGAIDGRGPGWLTTVRLRASEELFATPPRRSEAPGVNQPASGPAPQKKQITYLNIQFQRSLKGNLHRRELTFADQVKGIHGPVANWEQKLDLDNPDALGPQGVIFNCDQLTVREISPGAASKLGPVELEALGHTIVEGSTFSARGHRITYAQQKDLLVLEGDGRSDAKLFRQPQPGGPTQTGAARKIMYWRSANRVEISDAQSVDLSNFGSGLPGKPPQPKPNP